MKLKINATAKQSEALIRTLNATANKSEALFNSSYPEVIAFRSLTPPPPKQPPKTGDIPETAQAPGTHKNVVPTPNPCLPNMGSQYIYIYIYIYACVDACRAMPEYTVP